MSPPGTGPTTVRTVCSYCATGCGILLSAENGRVTGVDGDPDHPTNRGMLCAKGRNLHLTVDSPERARVPMLRQDLAHAFEPSDWMAVLTQSAEHFARIIREHGPRAVGFYVSGQLLTEDYYVFNKLMKGFIGANNIDSNSRLCMSSAVAGYKRAFGADGPPACYDDIFEAENLFIVGANPAFAHPILFTKMREAREERGTRLVVIDPRRTDSCAGADLHLALKPGSDVALLQAMLNVLEWEGLVDKDFIAQHTTGFEETLAASRQMSLRQAEALCGVAAGDIVKAALWFGTGKTLSFWTMGLNQSTSGVDKNNALINLHLATGQIGKPGCGPFSLTGQPNAMGGRETGSLANLLPAHRDLANPRHREEMQTFWGGSAIDAQPGLTAVEMIEHLETGRLKALWIVCTNPVVSLPESERVRLALTKAEWIMLSDAFYPTDTSAYAHCILPAAGWGEKEGTMTNAERRVARIRKVLAPPGEALADWEQGARFAATLGTALGRDWAPKFAYRSAEDVWDEHRRSTQGRGCDVSGLSYAILDSGPQQWPFRAGQTEGTARLYVDHRFATADQRARFVPVRYRGVAEPTSQTFPLALTTGRVRDQWHTMTKTGRVPALNVHAPVPMLQMHPHDAAARGLEAGELADVRSARGCLTVPVVVTPDVRSGVVFLPMHWGEMTARAGQVNTLFGSFCDPLSKQPEFKHCPVEVERTRLKWRGIVLLAGDQTELGRRIVAAHPYGTTVVQGNSHPVTTLEFGGLEDDAATGIRAADDILQHLVAGLDAMDYRDRKRRFFKRVWINERRLAAVRWVGFDLEGVGRLKNLMLDGGEFRDPAELFAGSPSGKAA